MDDNFSSDDEFLKKDQGSTSQISNLPIATNNHIEKTQSSSVRRSTEALISPTSSSNALINNNNNTTKPQSSSQQQIPQPQPQPEAIDFFSDMQPAYKPATKI